MTDRVQQEQQEMTLAMQDLVVSKRLGTLPAGSRIPDPVFDALAVMLEFLRIEDERAKK